MDEPNHITETESESPILYASDIDSFLYCHRAWWYRLRDEENSRTAQMAQGTRQHEALARQVRGIERVELRSRVIVWIVIVLLLLVLLARILLGF